MTKTGNIEKRWATTIKYLYAVDFVFFGILAYLIFRKIGGDPDVPTYKSISVIVVAIMAANIILFTFMRTIKNTVKSIVKGK